MIRSKISLVSALVLVLGTASIVACSKDEKKPEPTPVASASAAVSAAPSAVASAAPSASASAAPEDEDVATEEDFEEEEYAKVTEANLEQELKKIEDELK
jgi:hypothetical protein